MQRCIIHLDLDYFFAQCEEVRNPQLKGKPLMVCVYSGRSEDSGVISTANYEARKFGVKSGIPIVTAKKYLIDIPESIFLPMNRVLIFYFLSCFNLMGGIDKLSFLDPGFQYSNPGRST